MKLIILKRFYGIFFMTDDVYTSNYLLDAFLSFRVKLCMLYSYSYKYRKLFIPA